MIKIRHTYLFIFTLLFFGTVGKAQKFTFSDTYSVNNLDSLEAWLVAHPTPSVERLKNLIRLERTYRFGYKELSGQQLPEIKQLADALKSPIGQAAYFYLSSVLSEAEQPKTFQALDLFVSYKDTSGIIHALSKLATDNYSATGHEVGNRAFSEDYIKKAESLLSQRFDPHDFISITSAIYFRIYGKVPINGKALLEQAQETVNQLIKFPECQYAVPLSKTRVAIGNYFLKNYAESYRLNKEVLTILKPRQIHECVRVMLNVVNDCDFLGKNEERIRICQTARQLMLIHNLKIWDSLETIFISLKEEMERKGNYKAAVLYADSFIIVHDSIYFSQRDAKFIELQSQYQAAEKQKQIAELTLKQKESEGRNRFILTISFAALLVSVVFGLLWTQLRQKNKQLFEANEQLQVHTRTREQFFAIIAHDLRRPFHAFQGMNEMINYYLKKGDYASVEKISKAIDESGLRIRQLLDNLLKWALAQKEEVPYKPEKLNLLDEIKSVVSIYNSTFSNKNTRFEVVCADFLTVFADHNALELILRNLISNSLSAINDKSGMITFEATPQSNGQIKLTISDNGKGLDAVKIEAFRQVLANPSIGEVGQNGFGFGLVLIAKFAKRNGIAVDFQSQVGEGTTFELILPTI